MLSIEKSVRQRTIFTLETSKNVTLRAALTFAALLPALGLASCAGAESDAFDDSSPAVDTAPSDVGTVAQPPNETVAQPPNENGTAEGAVEPTPSVVEPITPRCAVPAGVSNRPQSILDVVDMVNALPKPVTLPCFLEALPRPLEVYATRGIISAQPAAGTRSPRLFVFSDPLIMTVVPDGNGTNLLELGELVTPTRSIKAEIAFPVEAELSKETPFAHLMFTATLTSCGVCHANEEPALDLGIANAYVSDALRPAPFERVPMGNVAEEAVLCDPVEEPERCTFLDALFDGGQVVERAFPEEMSTLY